MLQRSKAGSSLLFAARAARGVLSSSNSLAAAHQPPSASVNHDVHRNMVKIHPAGPIHAAICSDASEVSAQTPTCHTDTFDAASGGGRQFDSVAQNKQHWPAASPLTAAWHASHAATIGALHHNHHHQQQKQTSPACHARGLHTSAAVPAVAERVESARYADENPLPEANNSSGRSSSDGSNRQFQNIQDIAAVYDDMRDALRQSSAADESLEV